jgi:hypothetical protein
MANLPLATRRARLPQSRNSGRLKDAISVVRGFRFEPDGSGAAAELT